MHINFEDTAMLAGQYKYDGIMYSITEAEKIGVDSCIELCKMNQIEAAVYYHKFLLDTDEQTFLKQLNRMENHAYVASCIGSHLFILSVNPGGNKTYIQNLCVYKSYLDRIAKCLNKYNILLGVEFLYTDPFMLYYQHKFIRSLRELVDMLNQIDNANIKLVLDTFHMFGSREFNPNQISVPVDRIALIQLCDIIPCSDHLYTDAARRLPMESGLINAKSFIRTLKQEGYSGYITVETCNRHYSLIPCAKMAGDVKKALDDCLA